MSKPILVTIEPDFEAEDGTPFDALVDALEFAEIPATMVEYTQPELIAVTLDNGDVALFVNGDAVYQVDAGDSGQDPDEMGGYLAKALGVELKSFAMPVPSDDDWNWNDVYELLPGSDWEGWAPAAELKP